MKTYALTDTGLVRERNEDRYLVTKIQDGFTLLAVADGMGGQAAGDHAAEIATHTLAHMELIREDKEKDLMLSVEGADLAILNEVLHNSALEGMGTTLTAVLLGDGKAYWVHVGDSRLYLFRDNELHQITVDQNMAQMLRNEGYITAEEARTHRLRHVLDQCVGCTKCKPETGRLEIKKRDLLILMTDGLHGEVPEETITLLLRSQPDIESKSKALAHAALEAGGKDNITIVIAEI